MKTKDYNELIEMNSYELAEEMQGVITRYFYACDRLDGARNQEEFNKVNESKKQARKDLSYLCMVMQRVIMCEDYTEEAKKREDLRAKYANKYFRYGDDEVVFFNIGDIRERMSFESVSFSGEPKLQITSTCSFKRKGFSRTSYAVMSGFNQFGKYFCDSLTETSKEDFESFLDNKPNKLYTEL